MLSIEQINTYFPQTAAIYDNGQKITYLDSAATNLKLQTVIDATIKYYSKECANVHRGIHTLSELDTNLYEQTRTLIHELINTKACEEVIFTSGTTAAINMVALSWGESNVKKDDEVLISELEHHSNIIPWQRLCDKVQANLKVAPINDRGEIIFEEYQKLLSPKTKLVAINMISNTLGTINPIKEMIIEAKKVGAKFLVDAAQAVSHLKIDVQELDCDFLTISAHKMFGPTGTGALYAKSEILESMPPLFVGGGMVDKVSFEKSTFIGIPEKFEAGTPNIAGVIAWSPAVEFINQIGLENISQYENELLEYATGKLQSIPGLKIIGTAQEKSAVISFVIDGLHPHDIATMLNKYNIAIRTGHHCTQPIMAKMKINATARASFALYNTKEDVDHLVTSLNKIIELFS